MLEMCPASTDTSMHTTAPLHGPDSNINDRLVKLCPLVYQTCFELLVVSYPVVVNLLL